jgi:hypothetical protein
MPRRRPLRAAAFSALMGVTTLPAAGVAAAAEPLGALLGKLAPPAAPQGSVDVVGWVERSDGGEAELVVTFVPKGAVKLVADPGVTVTPVQRDGIAWRVTAPVSRVDAGEDYFGEPPTLRVPFAGEDGKPVEAAVEYAYCLVDYQCLFGEARVSAPTEAPRG